MFGYGFGDIVIHKIVQLLKEAFRNDGVPYRVNGACFVLLTRTLSMQGLCEHYAHLKEVICNRPEVDAYHPNLMVCGSALEIKNFDVNPQAMFSCLRYAYNLSREQANGKLEIFKTALDESRNDLIIPVNSV